MCWQIFLKFCFYILNKIDSSAVLRRLVVTSLFFRHCVGQWSCHRLFICWKYCLHGKFISLCTEPFLNSQVWTLLLKTLYIKLFSLSFIQIVKLYILESLKLRMVVKCWPHFLVKTKQGHGFCTMMNRFPHSLNGHSRSTHVGGGERGGEGREGHWRRWFLPS